MIDSARWTGRPGFEIKDLPGYRRPRFKEFMDLKIYAAAAAKIIEFEHAVAAAQVSIARATAIPRQIMQANNAMEYKPGKRQEFWSPWTPAKFYPFVDVVVSGLPPDADQDEFFKTMLGTPYETPERVAYSGPETRESEKESAK